MYSYYGDVDEGFRRGDAMITLPFPILILTPI